MRDLRILLSKKALAPVGVGVLAAIALTILPSSADSPDRGCAGDPTRADLAAGEGTIAIAGKQVVVIGRRKSGCTYQRPARPTGLLRHLAVRQGSGTAYVDDETGSDTVVVVTASGIQKIEGQGEASQPAWSADGRLAWAVDIDSLTVLNPASGATTSIAAPTRASAVFSPVFTRGSITVVAQEPTTADREPTEDDVLNNLWRYSEATRAWKRVTDFSVTGDEWSAIRTPVVTATGDVLFVRVHGHASATGEPSFELWALHGGRAAKLRDLPGEMFLAGVRNGRLLWNAYTPVCGDWELLVEDPAAGLKHLGCGAVLVDPVNLVDPDLLVETERTDIERFNSEASQRTNDVVLGVVVGDFATAARARRVAARIDGRVITYRTAPEAVRPGAFAVAVALQGGPERTLRSVRRALPGLRDMVFVSSIGKLGG